MLYAKVSARDAALLVRALGLLVSQAGIYGPKHAVTLGAAGSVFAELAQASKTYGPIEIAVKEDRILVNGSVDGLDEKTGKNLVDRMLFHHVGGLVFQPPLDVSEFLKFIGLFGTPPNTLAAEGGFEAALKKAALKSIQVVSVAYRRVSADEPAGHAASAEKSPAPAKDSTPVREAETPKRSASSGMGFGTSVLDLSAIMAAGGFGPGEEDPATVRLALQVSARKKRATEVASLLRETASLLEEQGESLTEEAQHEKVMLALNRIRDRLVESTNEAERHISELAGQVDEDRQTIDSIEAAARRKGIGIKLTRAELVGRYAELNQEIIQPLTVSSGVIEMLHSGKGGPLTEAQRDMLKLASDSVSRVNQLVAYINRVAGLPASLTPNASVIEDTYR